MPGVRVGMREAGDDGCYDVRYGDDPVAVRAQLFTGACGGHRFRAITPTPCPMPRDGPKGHPLDRDGARVRFGLVPAPSFAG